MSINSYVVNSGGEAEEMSFSDYSDFQGNKVYLVVDHNTRKVYIWKGLEAGVRDKFMSARAAQNMRMKLGMVYKVDSIDQSDEPKSFVAAVGGGGAVVSKPSPQPVQEQPVTPVVTSQPSTTPRIVSAPRPTTAPRPTAATRTASVPRPTTAPRPSTTPRPAAVPRTTVERKPVKSALDPSGITFGSAERTPVSTASASPTPASTPKPTPSYSSKPSASATPQQKATISPVTALPADLEAVQELLPDLEIPDGFQREIIIIKDTVYAIHKEYHKLFKKEVVNLERMDDLPAGCFPTTEYYTRLYIEEGKVTFIELFSELPKSEREEFIDDLKSSLKDLSSLGL